MNTPVALSQIIRVHYGAALKEDARTQSGPHQVFGSSGVVGHHKEALFDYPSIVIGRKGSVGTVTYAPSGGWAIDTAFFIERIDAERCHLRYLYYALSHANLARHTITTSIPGLSREDIYRTQVPLPLPDDQQRIADRLDKADAVRRKRRDAIALTEELLRAAFLEMVGPAARGYESWPVDSIESLAAKRPNAMRTGPFGSDLLHSEFVDEGVAVLGIDNAVRNRFAWGERRFITPEKYERLRRYTVHPGDVIVTIMGTTGRSAVVPADIPIAITTKHLATITLDRDRADPEFVSQALFRHPEVLRQIASANRGAIMSGLNLGLIKGVRLPIPPPERQREFSRATVRIREMSTRMEQEALEQQLFDSLMAQAFAGHFGNTED
jgi:type I restriction enzyme, S subunit